MNMSKNWLFVLPLLLVGQMVACASECPPGTQLQLIGTAQPGATAQQSTPQVSSTGHQVRMITQSCGASGCTGTGYDADFPGDATPTGTGFVNATVKSETGAPANESRTYVYDPPLAFVNGISSHNTATTNTTLFYECR